MSSMKGANPADALNGAFTLRYQFGGRTHTAYIFAESYADAEIHLDSIRKASEIDGRIIGTIGMAPKLYQRLFFMRSNREDKVRNETERDGS